jgi:hypothetical protein
MLDVNDIFGSQIAILTYEPGGVYDAAERIETAKMLKRESGQ